MATGYGDRRKGRNHPGAWRGDNLWALVGNGGMVSTVNDLARWMAARSRWFPEPDPPADLGARRRFQDGWFLARRPNTGLQIFHGGATDRGYIAMLRHYPETDTTLVLLSNTFLGGEPHIRTHLDEIEDLLFGADTE